MVQNGLDLARDVRRAHTDVVLAQQRAELTQEALRLRREIAGLAKKRLDAGDISELEFTTSEIDAAQSEAAAALAVHDVRLAQNRLRTLMGVSIAAEQIRAVAGTDNFDRTLNVDDMVATACAIRPDLRAAELALSEATERAAVARKQFMQVDAAYDANSAGTRGFESGPALRLTLPIFNRNRGAIAIADAQVEQTHRRFTTLRDQIELEVRTAFIQWEQAAEQRRMINEKVLPALKTAGELARRNYAGGGVPYFLVLQTTGQFIDARLRGIAASADVQRAVAELERSVGQRLVRSSQEASDEFEVSWQSDMFEFSPGTELVLPD